MEEKLSNEGISLVKRANDKGFLYGITYVDHTTGGVFNGSALGKAYSAKALQDRFPFEMPNVLGKTGHTGKESGQSVRSSFGELAAGDDKVAGIIRDIEHILTLLSRVEMAAAYLPHQWKKKKKRRRKGPSNNT